MRLVIAPKALYVQMFGECRIRYGRAPLPSLPAKVAELLAFLLLRGRDGIARSQAAAALWPDKPDEDARANLRRHLSLLLRQLPSSPHEVPWICADGRDLRWNPNAPVDTDVWEFETAVAQPGGVERALELYSGDLLPSLDAEWISESRDRYRQRATELALFAFEAAESRRDSKTALHYGRRLLQLDPAREDVVRRMIALRARDGDRAGALAEYRDFAQFLKDELAAEPMVETTALYEAIRRGESPESMPSREGSSAADQAFSATSFVGRARELAELRDLLHSARHLSLIGIGGIGKS
ncbi:MAG: hypothetical protein JO060_07105, partial [Candidatus Eremiobacteraeota bacterium]|nr:hypothetical protein [Candidatus Eremiobacteraeota bacterium]